MSDQQELEPGAKQMEQELAEQRPLPTSQSVKLRRGIRRMTRQRIRRRENPRTKQLIKKLASRNWSQSTTPSGGCCATYLSITGCAW